MLQKPKQYNMNKTIIAVYGRAGEGKSETIKNVVSIFENLFPFALIQYLENDGDILAIISLGSVKIGIESQGDPNSRMIHKDTIDQLIAKSCEIIVCATRTDGMTVKKVDQLAVQYGFNTIWKSSYYTNGLDTTVANRIAAEEIVNLIQSIIVGRI